MDYSNIRFATFFIVYFTCPFNLNVTDPTGFGFAYASSIYIFAPLCGALLNPALVLALAVTKKLKLGQALLYIIAEGITSTQYSLLYDIILTLIRMPCSDWSNPRCCHP